MRSERVARANEWVVEVVGRITVHAEPLHHRDRRDVEDRRPGEDRLEVADLEPEAQRGPSRFGRVAVAPSRSSEPPTDLDGRGERCLEGRRRQTCEAQERAVLAALDRPLADAGRLEPRLDALDESIALLTRERTWEVAHDGRVRIQRREG